MSRKREKGRGFFGRGRHDDDADFVEIDDESSRWWAERDHLNTSFTPPRPDHPRSEAPPRGDTAQGGFHAYFTTDSLFESGRRPGAPRPDETCGDERRPQPADVE